MNKIYNNVLKKLNNLIIDEKKKFRSQILNSINKQNSSEIKVNEYHINNHIYYSNGFTIYNKKYNTLVPIGFEKNNIFYIFQN